MPNHWLFELPAYLLKAVLGPEHAVVQTVQPVTEEAPPTPPPESRRVFRCGPSYPYDSTVRTRVCSDVVMICAWPSRGGMIVLDPAYACDFEWLGLHPLDPPETRDEDNEAEDAFCQRLLLLGAKWFDSEARYSIVRHIESMASGYDCSGNRVDQAFSLEDQSDPTMREKRLIRVGWPSTGGLWVAEFDTTWGGVDEEDNLLGDIEMGRLALTRSMDEKCILLKNLFEAKFFASVEEYSGYGFLKAWDEKTTGEVGPLLQPAETRDLYWSAYYGR